MNKWYQREAQHNDIVLSSRIRLARNVVDFPFHSKITAEQRKKLNEMVRTALEQKSFGDSKLHFIRMDSLNEIGRCSLMERHTVSREFIAEPEERMLVLSEDESVSMMVNEEDHIRIQVIANGLDLAHAYQVCSGIDDLLDKSLKYAFDEKLGFLTSCPTNLGTGLRASVMMHLPGLEKSGLISNLIATVSKLGLTIRGTYGEGSSVLGAIYQISNQITLGITEQDAIQNLESIVLQIIQSEKQAQQNLAQNRYLLEDTVYRSLGVLKYARMLSSNEFFEHISNIRLGISLGMVGDVSLKTLNELMEMAGSASVCEQCNKELGPKERDYFRSEMIRQKLGQ